MRQGLVQPKRSVAEDQGPSRKARRPEKPLHNSPKTLEDFERERMGVAPQE